MLNFIQQCYLKGQKNKINALKKVKKAEINTLKKAKNHLGELWDDQSSQRDIELKKGQKKAK